MRIRNWYRRLGVVKREGQGKSVQKLVAMLRDKDVPIPKDFKFSRTRAGRYDRSTGAWSWFIHWREGVQAWDAGSQWPVSELLKGFSVSLEGRDYHLDPVIVTKEKA